MSQMSNFSCGNLRHRLGIAVWVLAAVAAVLVLFLIQREQTKVDYARQQELILRDSLVQADVAAVVINGDQEITLATPALLALSGYQQHELLGQKVEILMPMAYKAAHNAGRAATAKQPQQVKKQLIYCQLRRKNGTNIPITTNIVGNYQAGGLAVITPTSSGIILEKIQELALKAADVGIWWLDVTNDRLVWDQRMHSIYGRDETNAWTPNYEGFIACVHPDDRPWVDTLLSTCITRRSYFTAVFRVLKADNTVTYVRAQGQMFNAAELQIFAGISVAATEAEYDGGRTHEIGPENPTLPSL